ncbi:hypothetical protein ANN_26646 [Periplaneta americana]|uniref:Mos1 transposase HTH domain-containing protein n=1 Tax=Periplaneta americana TaxID=6978 RepID=A0ABQ8RYV8_PERAM|nr:hypothetical protein ANN_26646 [Periplaneta americana]
MQLQTICVIARGRNARQCHTALLEACGREISPYRTVARWAHAFRNWREDVIKNMELADCNQQVEQSVRRLVKQDSVDGIRGLPEPMKGQDRPAGCWLLASLPHAEAEVDDHPTRMELSCG